MKLSQLKEMIAHIEANLTQFPSNPDPDIQFWVQRTENHPKAGPMEADQFIDYTIDMSDTYKAHRVDAVAPNVFQKPGDYTIPLLVAPFYTER